MKKLLDWLLESNRLLHLAGFFIGLLADDWYCALTFGSCLAGHFVRSLIF